MFDNVNDLVFWKWDEQFITCVKNLLSSTEENVEDSKDGEDGVYAVSQLYSPIVTSQRVMAAQFGNTYSSMQCKDGTNLVFDEWLDHVLLVISMEDLEELHRELGDCKTFIQHICGQNFHLLQSSTYRKWLSMLLESRLKGDNIPGVGGVLGTSGASAAALSALRSVSDMLKSSAHPHFHLLLYVGDKLLALYSSRGSVDLTPTDLILLSIQAVAAQEFWDEPETGADILESGVHGAKSTSGADQAASNDSGSHVPWLSSQDSAIVNLCAGNTSTPCAPHALYLAAVAQRITVAVVIDMELRDIGTTLCAATNALWTLRQLLLQGHVETLSTTAEAVESAVKKATEALRRNKANTNICTRLSSRAAELRRACSTTTPITPETAATSVSTALDTALEKLKPEIPQLDLLEALSYLQEKLSPYVDFLRVKAMRCFSLGSDDSYSLTRHKYVEEFPGLVHFVFIDRKAGRYLAPDMADCADMLTRENMRAIMNRALRYAHQGYTAATWRGAALHGCYVLWWEASGAPLRPRAPHPAAVRALPVPGELAGTFYRQLTDLCFPNNNGNVTVKELICIHLGLLPATTAIQQARRLAHTVHDVTGDRANPADLL